MQPSSNMARVVVTFLVGSQPIWGCKNTRIACLGVAYPGTAGLRQAEVLGPPISRSCLALVEQALRVPLQRPF